jgi:hypothetical protein
MATESVFRDKEDRQNVKSTIHPQQVKLPLRVHSVVLKQESNVNWHLKLYVQVAERSGRAVQDAGLDRLTVGHASATRGMN